MAAQLFSNFQKLFRHFPVHHYARNSEAVRAWKNNGVCSLGEYRDEYAAYFSEHCLPVFRERSNGSSTRLVTISRAVPCERSLISRFCVARGMIGCR